MIFRSVAHTRTTPIVTITSEKVNDQRFSFNSCKGTQNNNDPQNNEDIIIEKCIELFKVAVIYVLCYY